MYKDFKGIGQKDPLFHGGGGELGYLPILRNIYNICHFHRSYNEFPQSHSVRSGVPIIQREAIQSCAKGFKAKRRLDSDAQCSTLDDASPNPLYSSYVGLCAVRKSSRQVLDHMFNPFPQAGCRTLCKWTHHMSNAPSQYPMCRTLEQVQAHMANISASTLPSPVHKLPVVQYRACIYTERAMTYHPGLCWSCKADPWVGIQRNMQVPLKIDWYIYCLIRTNTNCKLHRFYWLIWAKIHLFYRNISTIINNSHFVELT